MLGQPRGGYLGATTRVALTALRRLSLSFCRVQGPAVGIAAGAWGDHEGRPYESQCLLSAHPSAVAYPPSRRKRFGGRGPAFALIVLRRTGSEGRHDFGQVRFSNMLPNWVLATPTAWSQCSSSAHMTSTFPATTARLPNMKPYVTIT